MQWQTSYLLLMQIMKDITAIFGDIIDRGLE